jgi:hypothetical protein
MLVIRDEKRIYRLKQISQWFSLTGMLALLAGLVMAFTALSGSANLVVYQLLALLGGWLLSQTGIFLAHRYARDPRPDEVLDQQVKKVWRDGRMYHYVLPTPHVLLTPTGIVVFIAKFQGGKISVEGNRWSQKGLGMRKFFGQEGLGNPSREAEIAVQSVANYLRKHAPSVEEVLIAPVIVFTTKQAGELDLKGSNIPAVHFTKLKSFLRQQRSKDKPMPLQDYEAIKAAFERKAAHLVAKLQEDDEVSA